jgi:REP-associated tyrosine transposase
LKYDPAKRRRRSIRLKHYDYTQSGAYFVTIVMKGRACLLGDIVDQEMRLNNIGHAVQDVWENLVDHYPQIELDAFVVMPNHVHGIIVIVDHRGDVGAGVGAGLRPAPTKTQHGLPEIVRAFKSFSARRINEIRHTPGAPIWQRNYFEHVIRTEESWNRIRQYILDNPARWTFDRENPTATAPEPENAWRSS